MKSIGREPLDDGVSSEGFGKEIGKTWKEAVEGEYDKQDDIVKQVDRVDFNYYTYQDHVTRVYCGGGHKILKISGPTIENGKLNMSAVKIDYTSKLRLDKNVNFRKRGSSIKYWKEADGAHYPPSFLPK